MSPPVRLTLRRAPSPRRVLLRYTLELDGSTRPPSNTLASPTAATMPPIVCHPSLTIITSAPPRLGGVGPDKKKAQAAKPPVAGVEVQSVKDEHI